MAGRRVGSRRRTDPRSEEAKDTTLRVLERLPAEHRPVFHRSQGTGKPVWGTEPVPLAVHETELSAQRELLSVLRLVEMGKVAVSSKSQRPTPSAMNKLTAVLEGGGFYPSAPREDRRRNDVPGPIRAFAWPMLLLQGDLAVASGTRLELTGSGRDALVRPAADTIASLWTVWMYAEMDELSRVKAIRGLNGKGKRYVNGPWTRRRAVEQALSACPTGMWVAVDEFFRYIRAVALDISVSRRPHYLYIAEPRYGWLGGDDTKRIIDERYVLCFLLEYAATLGLIDVALIPPAGARPDYHHLWGTDDLVYLSRYDGLVCFRVNALGAYCLGSAPDYSAAPTADKPGLWVMPNLEIAATGEGFEQADRVVLDAHATPVSDHVWRLEAGKLLAAVEDGRGIGGFRDFLEARSATPLPDTVSRLLNETAERSVKVRDLGQAKLIECADPELAALIANSSKTRRHCMPAGEHYLVVKASAETAFRRGLRELGYCLATGEAGDAEAKENEGRRSRRTGRGRK